MTPDPLTALRSALVVAFQREGGGDHHAELCQVCGEDRTGEGWVGRRGDPDRMCARCWGEGYYPGERRDVVTSRGRGDVRELGEEEP